MISKRRKLSECASDSNGEKQLNESFQKMELTGSVTTVFKLILKCNFF